MADVKVVEWDPDEPFTGGPSLENFPLSSLRIKMMPYHKAVSGESGFNRSFFVELDGEARCVVVSNSLNGGYAYFGQPAQIEIATEGLDSDAITKTMQAVTRHISSTVADSFTHELSISASSAFVEDPLHTLLLLSNHHSVTFEASIDLYQPDERIISGIRKAHRQSIQQGRKVFGEPEIYFGNVPRSVFDAFQLLHLEAAGRATRNQMSWNLMRAAIENCEAFLSAVRLNDSYVGFSFSWMSEFAAVYGTGAYDRSLLREMPVAHLPLFSSINFAKLNKRRRYYLGESHTPSGSTKEQGIAAFKRGFSSTCTLTHNFKVGPKI